MSVSAIEARIAEIQARFVAPPTSTPTSGADFGAVMSQAMSQAEASATATATAAGVRTPAVGWTPQPPAVSGAHATHNHGKVEPPAELRAYGNGKIPANALAPIGVGSHRMWAPAGAAFNKMAEDARAAGVNIGVTDSYRDYDAQVRLAEEKGLYSQGGLAATPGTSNHGWGLSLDLDLDPKALSWMRANAEKYGFVEDVPREPWHWTFHGGAA